MSSNIILPSLTEWTKTHITNIYSATSQSNLSNALDAFLSKSAVLTVNGSLVSRADFTKQVETEKFDEAGAIVRFTATVQNPTGQAAEGGSVGMFYTVIIQEAIRVRDAPVSSKLTVSLNVCIEEDPDIPVPPPSPIHGFSDRRRVKVFNQVITKEAVPFDANV